MVHGIFVVALSSSISLLTRLRMPNWITSFAFHWSCLVAYGRRLLVKQTIGRQWQWHMSSNIRCPWKVETNDFRAGSWCRPSDSLQTLYFFLENHFILILRSFQFLTVCKYAHIIIRNGVNDDSSVFYDRLLVEKQSQAEWQNITFIKMNGNRYHCLNVRLSVNIIHLSNTIKIVCFQWDRKNKQTNDFPTRSHSPFSLFLSIAHTLKRSHSVFEPMCRRNECMCGCGTICGLCLDHV